MFILMAMGCVVAATGMAEFYNASKAVKIERNNLRQFRKYAKVNLKKDKKQMKKMHKILNELKKEKKLWLDPKLQ